MGRVCYVPSLLCAEFVMGRVCHGPSLLCAELSLNLQDWSFRSEPLKPFRAHLNVFLLLLLPVYWYALNFEAYHQWSAKRKIREKWKRWDRITEIRTDRRKKRGRKRKEIVLDAQSSRPGSWRCRATLSCKSGWRVDSIEYWFSERKRNLINRFRCHHTDMWPI